MIVPPRRGLQKKTLSRRETAGTAEARRYITI